jgi:4-carboxymuconolactone decarboxylase
MNQDLYEAGLATRRQVLGDAHVDASLAAATEFSRDIQEYVTQYCWGDLWNRPGLSLQERSLINLSMITALNRPVEFKAHVRGAVNNGVSRDKIKEVLMQSAFYCGGPAALEAFRSAAEVFAAMDAEAAGTAAPGTAAPGTAPPGTAAPGTAASDTTASAAPGAPA